MITLDKQEEHRDMRITFYLKGEKMPYSEGISHGFRSVSKVEQSKAPKARDFYITVTEPFNETRVAKAVQQLVQHTGTFFNVHISAYGSNPEVPLYTHIFSDCYVSTVVHDTLTDGMNKFGVMGRKEMRINMGYGWMHVKFGDDK